MLVRGPRLLLCGPYYTVTIVLYDITAKLSMYIYGKKGTLQSMKSKGKKAEICHCVLGFMKILIKMLVCIYLCIT